MTYVMQVHEARKHAQRFFTSDNAGSYDSVARYATFGQDIKWKRRIIGAIGSSKSVLELACGTGILSSMLVSAGKNVTGLDLTFDYLVESRKKNRLAVTQATAEALPYREGHFDAVVSSYLAKYIDIRNVAEECMRVLQPAGIVVFHDFTSPSGATMHRLWKAYFCILRFIGIFTPRWRTVFDQLESVIEGSGWEGKAISALKETGFTNITLRYYTAGTAALVTAEKP